MSQGEDIVQRIVPHTGGDLGEKLPVMAWSIHMLTKKPAKPKPLPLPRNGRVEETQNAVLGMISRRPGIDRPTINAQIVAAGFRKGTVTQVLVALKKQGLAHSVPVPGRTRAHLYYPGPHDQPAEASMQLEVR